MGYAIDIVQDGPLRSEVHAMQNAISQEQRLAVDFMAMTVVVKPKQTINQVILNALSKLPSGQFAYFVTFWGQELLETWLNAAISSPGDARRVASLFEGAASQVLHGRVRRLAELIRPVAIQVKARPHGQDTGALLREAIA
jgi:hypothetical protein